MLLALVLAALYPTARPERGTAATNLPAGFGDSLFEDGLAAPTAMEFAPDGRLFVAEQGGSLRVIKDGVLQAQPFVTLTVSSSGERGLLGIAFDPGFATNHYVYVYYTATTPTVHNRVSRFTASGDVAATGSEFVVLELDNLSSATNHNGGAIHFGPDGKLYVATGENANGANAQSFENLLGKVLRINKDGTIPTDNPFYSSATGNNRAIWALGLRNPFTFAFQPGSGLMFINDVGAGSFEEIDQGRRGANYGWPVTEGPTTDPRFDAPIHAYDHSLGCAIAGGAFYNPAVQQFPAAYTGKYFFADLCGNWIRYIDPATRAVTQFATGLVNPVDLKVGPDGALYYLNRGAGAVGRIQFGSGAPSITSQPQSRTVAAGQQVQFSVVAGGAPPLSYRWQRNNADIPGATGPTFSLPAATLADDGGVFRVIVSNTQGSVTSDGATLTVLCGDVNDDGRVDFGDAIGVFFAFLFGRNPAFDVDRDGSVSFSDVLFVLTHLGQDCG